MLILTTPIGLYGDDLTVQHTFNKGLKLLEELEDLRFTKKKTNPRKFTIIINEAIIVFLITKRIESRSPHIRVNKF
jgi:hypothetical protein